MKWYMKIHMLNNLPLIQLVPKPSEMLWTKWLLHQRFTYIQLVPELNAIKLNFSSTPDGFLQFVSLSNPMISSTQFYETIPVGAQADGLWLFIQFNSRSADVRHHLHKILPLPLILSYLTALKAMSALIWIGLQTPLLLTTKFGFYERGILGFNFS